MITKARIILFCYLFIVGIATAMVAPADPSNLDLLTALTAAGLLGVVAMAMWMQRRQTGKPLRLLFGLLLCLSAALLGYSRYIAVNTTPDTHIGDARLGANGGLHLRVALSDTSQLRWHKAAPLDADVKIRLIGELDARQPVTDEHGIAKMDAQDRWQFTLVRQAITSSVITIKRDDPIGSDYPVPQPFTRIQRVELVEGPDHGSVALYRLSNHLGTFSRLGRSSRVTLLGRISGDPLVYDFKTILPVTPQYIQYPAGGPFYRLEGGDLHVTVKPDNEDYAQYARTEAYGRDVQIEGELMVARGAANPSGFDARRFMQNYNIFGLVNLVQPRGQPSPIHIIAPEGQPPRHGSPLVEFSLKLRDRVLGVIKLTMPYPQSAFLGGVTLGLRYGLPATPCLVEGCEELVVDEFKEAGVNHVLAVSGLHVTIITTMFVGIFVLLRLPKQAYVPVIIMALVVFAIITGARPSTLRAVIMNSLFLLSWAYMHQGLRASALIGVPVAAFMILLQNPLVVVDPSFTLSFGAILSLALLTGPFQELLMNLRGNQFAVFILAVIAWTAIGMKHWALVAIPSFALLFAAITLFAFVLAARLQARGIGLPLTFSYGAVPTGISTFLAAQFGIQIGMMIPLSVYYFCRWPFAGAYANLIAIPLIGIVVQLAAISGLLGLIPVVGLWIALLLNAANWLSASLFMWIAHISAIYFPYPFARRPGLGSLVTYYALCAIFIWRRPLWKTWQSLCARCRVERPQTIIALAAIPLALLTLPIWMEPPRHTDGQLRLTFLSVGYGSSILVESPGGKNILIDTAFVEHERGRQNAAIRTILPFLSSRGIRRLDGLILTSPLPERSAGASYILDHIWADYLFVPPILDGIGAGLDRETLLARAGLPADDPRAAAMADELLGFKDHPSRPNLAASLAQRHDTWLNRWANWQVATRTLKAGVVLFEEQTAGGPFRIEILNPAENAPDLAPRAENDSLVLRIAHGQFSALLTGDLRADGIRALLERTPGEQLAADLIVLPNRGTEISTNSSDGLRASTLALIRRGLDPLLDIAKPSLVLFEYGNPRGVLGDLGRDARRVHEIVQQHLDERMGRAAVLSTDQDMAVQITSDGRTWQYETQATLNRSQSGVEGAVSDIAVGF